MFQMFLSLISNIFHFALHIGSGGNFPRALTQKEETELLAKMKNGDESARSKLIEHNLRLVAHVIKKYYSNCGDHDDLISIGTIGLIKAVNTFDPVKGTKLATYAARCINNEILMSFRREKKSSQVVSINEPIETDSHGDPLTLMDMICTQDTIADDIDSKIKSEKLYSLIEGMTDGREKEIIIRRYGLYATQPLTQKEIASKLGISRSYVSRIEKKVLEELREKLDGVQI